MRHQCDREKSETVSLEIRIESLNRYQSSNRHSSDRLHFVRKLFKGHSCSDVSSNVTSIQKVQALRDQQIERNLPALGNEVVQGKFCLCPSEIPHFNQCAWTRRNIESSQKRLNRLCVLLIYRSYRLWKLSDLAHIGHLQGTVHKNYTSRCWTEWKMSGFILPPELIRRTAKR